MEFAMKLKMIFILILGLFTAANFGCKDNPVKPIVKPQDTTKKDTIFSPRPQIVGFSPEKGNNESMVIITGKYFGNDISKLTVWIGIKYFDRKLCKNIKLVKEDSITSSLIIKLPAGATNNRFILARGDSTDTTKTEFIFKNVNDPGPQIYIGDAYPKSGCPGEPFYIRGNNLNYFKFDLKLFFNEYPVTILSFTDTLITAKFVDHYGEFFLIADYNGKQDTSFLTDMHKIIKYPIGFINFIGIAEKYADPGQVITLICDNFGISQKPNVYFGDQEAEVISYESGYYMKIPYSTDIIYKHGTIKCKIPLVNPSSIIKIVGTCGTCFFDFDGLKKNFIRSAYADISGLKGRFYVKKQFKEETVDSSWNAREPSANITSSLSSKYDFIDGVSNSSYYNYYKVNIDETADLEMSYERKKSYGTTHDPVGDVAIRYFKIRNLKKISEDDTQIIYEVRGNDIIKNLDSINISYSYYVSLSNLQLEDTHLVNLNEQTSDSYIRLYLLKK